MNEVRGGPALSRQACDCPVESSSVETPYAFRARMTFGVAQATNNAIPIGAATDIAADS